MLIRRKNPEDGRSQLLYATEEAEKLRNSKASIEADFYEWLLAGLEEEERTQFCEVLNTLYERSKRESRKGFPHVISKIQEGGVSE